LKWKNVLKKPLFSILQKKTITSGKMDLHFEKTTFVEDFGISFLTL